MTITKGSDGSYIISDMIRDCYGNWYRVEKQYYFYTKREAQKRFKEYVKEQEIPLSYRTN